MLARKRTSSKTESYYDTKSGTVKRRLKRVKSYYDTKTGMVKHKRVNPAVPKNKFMKCKAVRFNRNGSVSIKK